MIDLSRDFCTRAAAARRALNISQSALAREIGCKQSALSMFEAGYPTKLSNEFVEKLAKRLDIPLNVPAGEEEAAELPRIASAPLAAFCPSFQCISNVPYVSCGRIYCRPASATALPGAHCAHCGEVLETACPACGAPVNAGACCAACGAPYIAVPPVPGDIAAWAAARRAEIAGLRSMFAGASA